LRDAQDAANAIGVKVLVLKASTEHDVDLAFTTLQNGHAGALVVVADPLFNCNLFIPLAVRHAAVPAVYFFRECVEPGGLMSYGTSVIDAYRQAGIRQERACSRSFAGGEDRRQPEVERKGSDE